MVAQKSDLFHDGFVRVGEVRVNTHVDQGARYLDLAREGRDEFLERAAPAALVRLGSLVGPGTSDQLDDEPTTVVGLIDVTEPSRPGSYGHIEVYPLVKKPGAAFSDMITVGRTGNNDVVLDHVTISRFHAYFKNVDGQWRICDSGSKNGTKLGGQRLEARKETAIESGNAVRFGDVEARFMTAAALFDFLVAAP